MTYFVLDHSLVFDGVWEDVVKRPYITAGFTAFVLMIPLALTSTQGWIRRLGGRNWNLLHRLVYVTAIGAALHYFWKVKLDTTSPVYYAAIVGVLLGAACGRRRRSGSAASATRRGARGPAGLMPGAAARGWRGRGASSRGDAGAQSARGRQDTPHGPPDDAAAARAARARCCSTRSTPCRSRAGRCTCLVDARRRPSTPCAMLLAADGPISRARGADVACTRRPTGDLGARMADAMQRDAGGRPRRRRARGLGCARPAGIGCSPTPWPRCRDDGAARRMVLGPAARRRLLSGGGAPCVGRGVRRRGLEPRRRAGAVTARAAAAGLDVTLVRPWQDVDTEADLRALIRRDGGAVRTRTALAGPQARRD